jgi:hypothetical protein
MANDVHVTPPMVPGVLDGGDGTPAHPFNSVAKAMCVVAKAGGGVVHLHGGHYVESVCLEDFGSGGEQMTVCGDGGGGEAFIDSMLPEFLAPETIFDHWFPHGLPDVDRLPEFLPPHIPHDLGLPLGLPTTPFIGEYVWGRRYATGQDDSGQVHLGAFLDEPVHTRLVSYDRIEDLRAFNQRWPDCSNGQDSENRVWRPMPDPNPQALYVPEDRDGHPKYRPWVYMGPGIWFDRRGDQRIHIRLSPTANSIPGWPDYDPQEQNPNRVRLALCRDGDHAMLLRRVQNVVFKNVTLRFGNPSTVRLNSCTNVVFDHCRIRAGSRALDLVADGGPNADIALEHCVVDGGIPTWYFRSDRKDNYVFSTDAPPLKTERTLDGLEENKLGYSTSGVQLSSGPGCEGMVVHHCEIYNGHDSYVFGHDMEFHHNWVHNLNDDGIAFSGDADTKGAKVYCNVMTQCLTALSFAAGERLEPIYIYGNLFDLREPTLGKRPTGEGVNDSLRQGHFFKDGANEGSIYLFHNTCLVFDPGAKGDDREDLNRAGFSYYSTIKESDPRPSYNNIFVAAFTLTEHLKPISYLPPNSFGPSDGNTYLRIPRNGTDASDEDPDPNFVIRYVHSDGSADNFLFLTLCDYREHYWPGDSQHGYETAGQLGDPGFKSFDSVTGRSRRGDDLRLRFNPKSPAKETAFDLPADLASLLTAAIGPTTDRGCYPPTGARLQVGVDGRMVYPWMRPGPRQDIHSDDVCAVLDENG